MVFSSDGRNIVFMKAFIYCLINPFTGKPFYVGVCQHPVNRFYNHISYRQSTKKNTLTKERYTLLDKIRGAGMKPGMVILRKCDILNAGKWERHFYNKLSKQHRLLQSAGRFYIPFSTMRVCLAYKNHPSSPLYKKP